MRMGLAALAAIMVCLSVTATGCVARREPRVLVEPTYSYLRDPLVAESLHLPQQAAADGSRLRDSDAALVR